MIRVLLVDDQAIVRRGLRVRFRLEPDLQVVGEANSGTEALTLAQAAGAVAFVEKRGETETLLSAIRQAAAQAGKSRLQPFVL
jgi:DNA-binding NarL/FixJ family response regulator